MSRVHPRVCGEAAAGALSGWSLRGPSPRVRGSPSSFPRLELVVGSIPACAGKPGQRAGPGCGARVHPRVCGEAGIGFMGKEWDNGPSPRVRGSRPPERATRIRDGSIPACAGKPDVDQRYSAIPRVHPRVCGEASPGSRARMGIGGPSPRVRGSLLVASASGGFSGSIPACAGKPPGNPAGPFPGGVHPRVCGEALAAGWLDGTDRGPSPRVRGSRTGSGHGGSRTWSIPACAGKPFRHGVGQPAIRVHPRVCGEAVVIAHDLPPARGPSPRVRGSRRPARHRRRYLGSIPACAGKPIQSYPRRLLTWVHPRVCGEARIGQQQIDAPRGPSPRVRGSRSQGRESGAARGSIPACAGKPGPWRARVTLTGVHPRVCGEAVDSGCGPRGRQGPSPRVRGSLCWPAGTLEEAGSIPACAGKPRTGAGPYDTTKVHPRVCGEAAFPDLEVSIHTGPSPRVRGSHDMNSFRNGSHGSIPACAGKPSASDGSCGEERVHPRVCGEAGAVEKSGATVTGPSPRVRGSPTAVNPTLAHWGSIPACAGKPPSGRRSCG